VKRNLLKRITIVLFLLFGCTLWANGVLQYYITQEKVESAWVVDNKDGSYSVVIKLKEPYKEEFGKITAKNIGKKLQIIFQGQILVQARIQDEIPSGIITVDDWTSAEDALKFIDTLHTNKKGKK
jgi:preprotein translocase subunit SecD